MLSQRFRNDGKSTIDLSAAQIAAIVEFKKNEDTRLQPLACILCGNTQFEMVSEKDRYGFHYPTGVCKSCGNVQQLEYYNTATVHNFYEKYYRRIYGTESPAQLFKQQYGWSAPRVFEFCKELIPPGTSILEIGCGAGGIIKYFSERGFNVEGLDLDQQYLEFGRSNGLRLFASDLNSFSPSRPYRLIILSHVLEHLTQPHKALETIRSLMGDGSLLYVEVPSLHSVPTNYDADLLRYFQNAHVIHFTQATLANLVSRAGLAPVQMNNIIQALYSAATNTSTIILSEYQASITELRNIEAEHKRRRKITTRIRTLSRKAVVAAITRLHCKTIVKAVIERLKLKSKAL